MMIIGMCFESEDNRK